MTKKWFGADRNISFLGIVSLLTDVSSEMIFSVFSVFFTVVLGASAFVLGILEGMADFAASSLDYISGYLSDKSGERKIYIILGYGFSVFAKTILVISNSLIAVGGFRVIERFGKSFRGPPKDAWIASLADKERKGYAFALYKTFDKIGAIIGPFIAYFILSAYGQNLEGFKILFVAALIPAFLAVCLLLFIKDKKEIPSTKENIFSSYSKFSNDYKHFLKSACIFSIAYFSFAFLLLRAYNIGFLIKSVILLYALFNISFVLSATIFGKIADRFGKKKIIVLEYVLYLIMIIGFIFVGSKTGIIILFLLYGLFYAIDVSQTKAYISDMEKENRATALGLYNFLTGMIYLPASIIAGLLWTINSAYSFIFAGIMTFAALIYFVFKRNAK